MLNRILEPNVVTDTWEPGCVICDTCASLMFLHGKLGTDSLTDADLIVCDTDLRNNSPMYTRQIKSLCLGEQPWDRAGYRAQHLIKQCNLNITEFDRNGVPNQRSEILQLLEAWEQHMTFGLSTGQVDATLSHWPELQDPLITKEILSQSVKPPSFNNIYRVPIQDVEAFQKWEAFKCTDR